MLLFEERVWAAAAQGFGGGRGSDHVLILDVALMPDFNYITAPSIKG